MTTSSLKPFMAYLTFEQHARLRRFAAKSELSMTQIIRESLDARISPGDRYSSGYNAALKDAMQIVLDNKAAKMRFPSGKSFAELVNEEIKKNFITEVTNEGKEDVGQHEAGSPAGNTGGEGQGDPDMGL